MTSPSAGLAMREIITLLNGQHDEITAAVQALARLLSLPHGEAAAQLGAVRSRIAQLISHHMKTEEELLYAPIRNRRLADRIPCYAAVIDETRTLRLAYSAHIGQWRASAIEADWATYVATTLELDRAFDALRDRKRRELYPQAARLLAASMTAEAGSRAS